MQGSSSLAIVDSTLSMASISQAQIVSIDNFSFTPATLTVAKGSTVVWTNKDDIPHTVVDTQGRFKSPALDTNEKWEHTFNQPGIYEYFCSVHATMKGKVIAH